jgi:hypothetical protein
MLVGYMRVSKADGSQTVELQRDALLAAGVDTAHLYDDHASGRSDDRSRQRADALAPRPQTMLDHTYRDRAFTALRPCGYARGTGLICRRGRVFRRRHRRTARLGGARR